MHPCRLSSSLLLEAPVSSIPGISQARSAILAKRKLYTVRDLLMHIPHRYVDMTATPSIASCRIGELCTLVGQIHEIQLKRPKPGLQLVEISLIDDTGLAMITCFRQPWMIKKYRVGDYIAASGKIEFSFGFKRMTNPVIEKLEEGQGPRHAAHILPIHGTSEGLSTASLRQLMQNALLATMGMSDPLPVSLRQRYRLFSRQHALRCIHFPHTQAELHEARRRLKYEEVLYLELYLMHKQAQSLVGLMPYEHVIEGDKMDALKRALPYTLTQEQQQCVEEILERMKAPRPANHMLLGDVGTGKTVVAAHALVAAAQSNNQALMMAPTEVLAQQYAQSIGSLLDACDIRWDVLTGSTPADKKQDIYARLASGELSIVFGTHALLEEGLQACRISLVVIDEQQRFGVSQRAALRNKGRAPDCLALTATPIPRSMARALFADTTLSYLTERPFKLTTNTTQVLDKTHAGNAYEACRKQLEQGRQAYVVCPLVGKRVEDRTAAQEMLQLDEAESYAWELITIEDDSYVEKLGLKEAHTHAEYLQTKIFPGHTVGVLHGKMSAQEKASVMEQFVQHKIDVLVSTTVIEVGIDVPNAVVMIVEDADRFGLSQLHQLRGRVGRGEYPAQTFLISGSRSDISKQRLSIMEQSSNGFEIAEHDLALRREGDILGNRQHGASSLKLVHIMQDKALISAAHDDAKAIIDADPLLEKDIHQELRQEISQIFG